MKILILLFLLAACPAEAAITAAGTTASANASGTSLTFTHDSGATGSNCMTVLGILNYDEGAGSGITSAKYNSVDMLLATSYDADNGSSLHLSLYYKLAPFRGSANVDIVYTSNDVMIAGAQTYCGVNQATPFGTSVGTSFSAATITSNVTSAAGELVIDIFGESDTSAVTVGGGQSQLWQINAVRSAGMSTEAGAGTVTMSWTGASDGERQVQLAIPIKPSTVSLVPKRRPVLLQ